ncbi:MAG: hypothetical protein LBF62_09300, partial [Tannerellaceae bacterium]|nr:hypothetical protein [Tannerellaceae bacterium]
YLGLPDSLYVACQPQRHTSDTSFGLKEQRIRRENRQYVHEKSFFIEQLQTCSTGKACLQV